MSILALDVGDVRVGVAAMDLSVAVPLPLMTVNRAKGEAEETILELCHQRSVTQLIIGIPLSEDGSENQQSEKVRNFARRLMRRIEIEIEFVDEYYSSEEASERLRVQGISKPEIGRVDALAATILIERYLAVRRETLT